MVLYGIVGCLCVLSVPGRAPSLRRFWPKFGSSVTGTEDVPPSVQSDLNVQSLEVDLSRLFHAMPVPRGCGAARPFGSGLCPPGFQFFSLAAIAFLSILALIFCSCCLDTGSLDLETDFDDENLFDTFLGWGQSGNMRKDLCVHCLWSIPSRQVVCAAWAAAAFAFGYLVFIFVCSAAAASAGACFISLSLEGANRAAAALMTVATLGGSVTASFKLLFMFFEGSGAALVSVSAAAFRLLCAATAVAVAGAFGTVVVGALPYDLADGGFTRTGNPTFRGGTAQPQPQPVHKGKPDMTSALKGDGMAVVGPGQLGS